MKFYPIKIHTNIVYFALLSILILISCSKDGDLLRDAVFSDNDSINEVDVLTVDNVDNTVAEEVSNESIRTTSFPPINDAHFQSGKGYNQNIIRLEEGNRTSYLMFDLSAIETIEGEIVEVALQFTISNDDGNGNITVFKGDSNNWTEEDLASATIPEAKDELGTVTKTYEIGDTEIIDLNTSNISPKLITLILDHKNGNDLAFASKEHSTTSGPKLVVTYKTSLEAAEIQIEEQTEQETSENQEPIAIADGAPATGKAPLEVTFTGANSSSENEIKNYLWNFKDGSNATDANPTHTFTTIGTYEVLLTVEDNNGLKSTDTVTINVTNLENEAPKIVMSANPMSGEAPLEVNFDSSQSTDDNGIKSYLWDFKDGNTANNAKPTHTFENSGVYDVELTIEDENGLSATQDITITVNEPQRINEAPSASATSNTTSGEAPLTINFSSHQSSDDDEIVSYAWNFKDGATSSEINPTHTFENPGVYKIEFTVTDADGLTDTDIDTITVTEAGNSGGNTGGGSNGNYPSHAVFASSYGFQSGDATEAFKDAINSGNSYVVIDKQSSDWVIQPTKFFDLTNMTIVFEQGVKLRAKSGAFPNTHNILFLLTRPKNVTIEGYGAEFKMNKSEYTSGEGRHAFGIYQGNGVTIKGLTLSDSGGDGIYIAGGSASGSYSQNITIEDVVSTNNRRQGMSIISAQDVWVRNSEFSNTKGASPEAGVDLEPNKPEERIVNINFSNCKFTNNDSHGFVVGVGKLTSASIPISVTVKDCYFSNNSLSPNGSAVKTELLLSQGVHNNPVKGSVLFERLTFNNTKYSIIFSKLAADSYTTTFKDCKATNVNKSKSGAVIELQASSVENTLGGIEFGNFYLEYSANAPFMKILAPNTSGFKVKDITGNFTIKEPYDNDLYYTGGYNPANNSNVNINYQHIN